MTVINDIIHADIFEGRRVFQPSSVTGWRLLGFHTLSCLLITGPLHTHSRLQATTVTNGHAHLSNSTEKGPIPAQKRSIWACFMTVTSEIQIGDNLLGYQNIVIVSGKTKKPSVDVGRLSACPVSRAPFIIRRDQRCQRVITSTWSLKDESANILPARCPRFCLCSTTCKWRCLRCQWGVYPSSEPQRLVCLTPPAG